ncbi:MAG TPA: GNAT family N-acetyltransferase, partial [Rhabdochlamydiaceae bacterium]
KGSIQVEIETPRLLIRSYNDQDFEDCVSLYGSSKTTKYFDHGKPRSEEEVKELVREKGNKFFKKGQPFGLFSIFLKNSMTFIGQIDLLPSDKPGVVEIGFILLPKYQNKGFCSEGVKALLSDYLNELNAKGYTCKGAVIREVMATVHPENLPSKKLMEKMGMNFKRLHNRFGSPRLWYSYKLPLLQPA